MKIMLVLPKFETHIITPPLGLGYLASSLRNAGNEVILLDCVLENIGIDKFSKILDKEKPDFVGINAMTTYYLNAKKYAEEAKKHNAIVCMGGPHPSALPKEVLQDDNVDFVIVGEADRSIVQLINSLQNKKNFSRIPGLGFKRKNKIIINKPTLTDNLNSLPFPAWDLIDPRKYPFAPHGAFAKRFPVAPITTTRGCPFNCSFCASKCIWLRKLRFRDPKKVADEIETLYNKFDVREFHFEDDNFTLNREHAVSICRELIKRKLDIVWACPNGVRIDRLDKELLQLMKKSGCYLLAFGIESGDQKTLDKLNKQLDLKKVPEILKLVKEVGIETCGFFILGSPQETKESITKTIDFAIKNKFDRAQFSIFIPLPGSEIFDKFYLNKKDLDWGKFNPFNISDLPEGLTEEDLKKLHKKAFRKFYFRPKIMLNLFKNIRLKQIKWLIKRAKQYKFFNRK